MLFMVVKTKAGGLYWGRELEYHEGGKKYIKNWKWGKSNSIKCWLMSLSDREARISFVSRQLINWKKLRRQSCVCLLRPSPDAQYICLAEVGHDRHKALLRPQEHRSILVTCIWVTGHHCYMSLLKRMLQSRQTSILPHLPSPQILLNTLPCHKLTFYWGRCYMFTIIHIHSFSQSVRYLSPLIYNASAKTVLIIKALTMQHIG